jgi:hypothetical protein
MFRESDECRRLDYYRNGNALLVTGFDEFLFGNAYHYRDQDPILGAVLENYNTDGFKGIFQSFLDSRHRTPHSPEEEIRNLKIVNGIQKSNPRWLANKSVSVAQLVLKTGPFPLNSLETNTLIASLALIAVEKVPKDQMTLFSIIRIWNSRRYTETSLARRVDDETILLGMYRYYLGTAHQKHLHISGAPIDIISFLQAIRPIYDIEDSSYAQKLKDCNERTTPPKVVIERMATVYVEFGNGDPGREDKFISLAKTLLERYFKTEYQANHAQRGCKKVIRKLVENELDLFSSNLNLKDKTRIRDWQEGDALFDKDNRNDFFGGRCLMETEKPKLPESCRRELALLAHLEKEDPRRKIVFAAVKSIELFDGVSQLQEWDSKRRLDSLETSAADEIRKELLAVELCDPVNALQELHKLRLQHPALIFGNDIRAPAAPPAQKGSDNAKSDKKRAKNHGKDRNSTDLVEEEEAMNVASKKQRAEHAKSSQVKDTDRAETADQEATTSKKDDKIASMVISMLENVVKAKTSWPVVLSVVRHIFEGHDKFVDGMQMAKAKIIEKYHLTSKCDLELLEKQAGLDPCVYWGGIYREYLEVQLCSHKLVTVTLEEMTGHPVKCFKIADHLGFKTLQFQSDCIPVTEHYLSLSTGFIDGDENQSVVCFKLDSEFVDSVVADVLIKNGIAKRLGLLGKEKFLNYAPSNGKWVSLDEGAAVALVQRELTPLFLRLCNLRAFKEAVFAVGTDGTECTGSLSADRMRICLDKFVNSYEKARKVLKALEPFIKISPVMHTKKLLAHHW